MLSLAYVSHKLVGRKVMKLLLMQDIAYKDYKIISFFEKQNKRFAWVNGFYRRIYQILIDLTKKHQKQYDIKRLDVINQFIDTEEQIFYESEKIKDVFCEITKYPPKT